MSIQSVIGKFNALLTIRNLTISAVTLTVINANVLIVRFAVIPIVESFNTSEQELANEQQSLQPKSNDLATAATQEKIQEKEEQPTSSNDEEQKPGPVPQPVEKPTTNTQSNSTPKTNAATTEKKLTASNSTTNSQPKTTSSTPPPEPAPAPAPAPAGPSHQVLGTSISVSYINSLRSAAGKSSLSENSTLNGWALAHTKTQADECNIWHQNISTFLGRSIGATTVMSIGENVGYAGSINSVLNALRNSSGHYANMVGDFNYVGTGSVVSDSPGCKGYVFTTQLFAK